MPDQEPGTPDANVKACCADLYSSEIARWLLGDSFHPGGLSLTSRLGELLDLGPRSYVLDIASGRGTSAIHLAEQFGCRVLGLEYSTQNVALARSAAAGSVAGRRVDFIAGDAEQLPLAGELFDAVICECSFCTFPDKTAAAAEFSRVLRGGGRLGLSDLTRVGPLPLELDNLLGHVMCVADAQSVESYVQWLIGAGFQVNEVEQHDDSLMRLISDVRARLLSGKLLVHTQQLALPEIDLDEAQLAARSAATAVYNGTLGYSVIIASKPELGTTPQGWR